MQLSTQLLQLNPYPRVFHHASRASGFTPAVFAGIQRTLDVAVKVTCYPTAIDNQSTCTMAKYLEVLASIQLVVGMLLNYIVAYE